MSPSTHHSTPRRRLLADRFARWVVVAGGLGVIASIVGILLFVGAEVVPLLRSAEVESEAILEVDGDLLAVTSDEYRVRLVGIDAAGRLLTFDARSGAVLASTDLLAGGPASPAPPPGEESAEAAVADRAAASATESDEAAPAGPAATPPRVVAASRDTRGHLLSAATDDGRVIAVPLAFAVTFEAQTRVVEAVAATPVVFALEAPQSLVAYAVALDDDGNGAAALLAEDGSLTLVEREASENFLTGEVTESLSSRVLETPVPPSTLVVDRARRNLYGGTATGELLWWDLAAGATAPQVSDAGGAVTALGLLVGERSLVVGREDGAISVWFQVRDADDEFRLTHIRDLEPLSGAVVDIAPSLRNKGFVAAAANGQAGLYHSTSDLTLWRGSSGLGAALAVSMAPKADGAFVAGPGRVARIAIDNPHPEATLQALFGKVWYEGYEEPAHSWQSTGGTDDFEPKFGFTPLMIGTLKGTVFSLLLAIPFGVLGAMYTSQFMHPRYQRVVKPTVEIMAALPTVVLGFLAGLWLAPIVEQKFAGIALLMVLAPLLVVLAGLSWGTLPRSIRNRYPAGTEGLLFVGVVAFAAWVALAAATPIEAVLFDGSFPQWLRDTTGMTYDQRNAIVVGLAMGLAVIPIIFAISEDAFSNVPRNLVAGSLALGANRWQTVTRVVLPTASPGIFSAIMVGFGRAVGETMIVLMATGNTPIMSWSPFNGFRTLSANIAVEIPEAPIDSTLYRMLFLAALVLFLFTFAVNTLAEVVRQRLRSRYSRL